MNLTFIINGEETLLDVTATIPISYAADTAIHLSHNASRLLSDWECRDATGVLLETYRSPEDLNLRGGDRLFLSVRVGAGGAHDYTDAQLTEIYNRVNGIEQGKRPPITTQRIFNVMRAMANQP